MRRMTMRSAASIRSVRASSPKSTRSKLCSVHCGPLQSGALMPKVTLRGRQNLKLRAVPLRGKKLGLEIGLLGLTRFADKHSRGRFYSLAKRTVPGMVAKQKPKRAIHSN